MPKLRIALLILSVNLAGSSANAELLLVADTRPGQVTVIYDPIDGNLSADSGGAPVTTFWLVSDSGVLTGERPPQLLGIFDDFEEHEMFHLTPGEAAWQTLDFGPALAPGLGPELADDLTLAGSFLPRGAFDAMGLQIVPEPTGAALVQLGGLMALAWWRTRRNRRPSGSRADA